MDFTNRRFPNPSSCEYQLLEVDFSPTMKRPSSESIMGFNINVSYFHKPEIRRIGQRKTKMQSISQNQHCLWKVSNQFNLVRPRVIYGSQEIILSIQKTSKTSLDAPAHRGSGGSSFTSTCLICSLEH
ncbi:unnamed protein product [Brassica rapa]|uniref:Uncharacterized protein n=1 Tax=Brassica campestris TaxID=3711 RepID=A0A8D9MEX1_BRACM|nr:unnamed protein product [Brassica rapa]